jgi:Cu2+-exporting ATPase/Cu+-exporting ATPase
MLFVIPVYAGLSGTWSQVFNVLSFLLFLPILFYSAVPFYRGAWTALKYQSVNVDLPITLALLMGFSLSTFNLIRGEGHIYFDSTASFLFFILSARFLLKRIQQNYLAPLKVKSFLRDQKFLCFVDNEWVATPAASLKADHVLKVTRGQTLPADAELLSSHAQLDMSLFNGESLPRTFSQGMKLFAGTVVLDQDIEIRLSGSFNESRLGQLLKELNEGALTKSPFIALTDRLAQKLIVTVFALAVGFFIFYAPVNMQEAFNRALALIVLACPCALAFGSPLTFGLALRKAQKNGILLKDAGSLEKLLTIKHVFFDKTGTLTQGQLKLSHCEPALISVDLQKIILSLEAPSYHPVAFALRSAWNHPQELCVLENCEEILGRGVRARYQGHHYEIRHLAESVHESELAIEVLKDGLTQCRLYFSDQLRIEARDVVAALQKQNIECHLLSGDKKSRVFEIAQRCGIQVDNVFAELFPEDKKKFIDQYKDTCMIGDGANDSLSLKAADVGIAVKGSVDLSLHSADIYFTRGGLTPFLELLKLSKQTQNVLIRNLSISLIYNLIGGVCALLGFINPMMAAILMPISSALIIMSSLWGFR